MRSREEIVEIPYSVPLPIPISSNHFQRRDHHIAYHHVHTLFARGVRRRRRWWGRRGGGARSLGVMSEHMAGHGTHGDSHFRGLE